MPGPGPGRSRTTAAPRHFAVRAVKMNGVVLQANLVECETESSAYAYIRHTLLVAYPNATFAVVYTRDETWADKQYYVHRKRMPETEPKAKGIYDITKGWIPAEKSDNEKVNDMLPVCVNRGFTLKKHIIGIVNAQVFAKKEMLEKILGHEDFIKKFDKMLGKRVRKSRYDKVVETLWAKHGIQFGQAQ